MSLIYGEYRYLANDNFGDIPHTFIPHLTFHSMEKIHIEFSANYVFTTFRIPCSAKWTLPHFCTTETKPNPNPDLNLNLTNLLTLLTILTLLNPTLPHDDVRYPWELEIVQKYRRVQKCGL